MKKPKKPKTRFGLDTEAGRFKITILLAAIIAAIFLSSPYYMPKYEKYSVDSQYCMTASDCVPEQCCHQTSCVNRYSAPDCSAVACTLNCEPETMDCGQGSCNCIHNTCMAVIG